MSAISSIEWTDATWNPVRGCSRVSEGCRNCYAEQIAARFSDQGGPFHQFAKRTPSGPRWTGKVELVERHLRDPLKWREPRRIFVNSMSDLFHEGLPFHAIDDVFDKMMLADWHTYQILTKRPERMYEYFDSTGNRAEYLQKNRKIWLGVSVEDQDTADKRIPHLLRTPAAVRFVSYELALEPVRFWKLASLDYHENTTGYETYPLAGIQAMPDCDWDHPKLDMIIIGGESGPGARPFNLRWARSVIKECAGKCSVFIKQLGAKPGMPSCSDFECAHPDCSVEWLKLKDRKGGDMSEWPIDLRVREWPK